MSHSQTTSDLQPDCDRASRALASFALLRSNLALQKSTLVWGILDSPQPWECQKQPWTNTTHLLEGKTMSGLPGSLPWHL